MDAQPEKPQADEAAVNNFCAARGGDWSRVDGGSAAPAPCACRVARRRQALRTSQLRNVTISESNMAELSWHLSEKCPYFPERCVLEGSKLGFKQLLGACRLAEQAAKEAKR